MILLQLYLAFVKIGFSSFGGMTMIPIINDQVVVHGWMTSQELMDVVAIAEMTPGSLGINCSTFVGIRTAGVLGAIFAALGVMTPTFTLTMAAVICIEKLRGNRFMEAVLNGVRPVSLGMLLSVLITMSEVFILEHGGAPIWAGIAWNRILLSLILLIIHLKTKLSIPMLILLSVILGLAIGW